MKILQTGKYRHYKGNEYEVLSTARHSETEEWFVVYRTCYGDFSTWIRPLAMFTETVRVAGKKVPRFAYIGDNKAVKHSHAALKAVAKEDKNSDILQALNDSLGQ